MGTPIRHIEGVMLSQALSSADSSLLRADSRPVEWIVSPGYADYVAAEAAMEARVAAIHAGEASERVWLLEHPPLYTAGVSAKDEDLIDARFPVHRTGRGGQFTYHGPGQRVGYVMLNLAERGRDVRGLVRGLERWIIGALAEFGVEGEVKDGRVGVWVTRKGLTQEGVGWSREDKIAAIGVKVRKWVSFHGISLNVEPDLDHFGGIVPCGIREHGVTSLHDLGILATMDEVDAALNISFRREFGPTIEA
jgi:lipoyl(octanoyl) transferase